jgi:PhnB protein
MTEVTPHIVVHDAGAAAEWYERALGAEIGDRIPVPDGRFMQIELRFGDSRVLIADEFPEFGAVSPPTVGGTYGALTITTDSVDELWERALAEGAQVHSPLQDGFWGERHGQILDPFGHRWGLAQHLEDVPQDEIIPPRGRAVRRNRLTEDRAAVAHARRQRAVAEVRARKRPAG